jgi:hypothetical protein
MLRLNLLLFIDNQILVSDLLTYQIFNCVAHHLSRKYIRSHTLVIAALAGTMG